MINSLQFCREALRVTAVLVICGIYVAPLEAGIQLQVTPSLPAPQPIGTKITFTASASDTNPGVLSYRFEYAPPRSSTYSMLRDYSAVNKFDWATIATEGVYQIRITARNYTAGGSAQKIISFNMISRVVNGQAVVSGTGHPLVALFSAPPCATGSSMRVSYLQAGGSKPAYTGYSSCGGIASMNFYVTGLLPNTSYSMNYEVVTAGSTTQGPVPLPFQTGSLPITFPTRTVTVPPAANSATSYRYVLSAFPDPAFLTTDLSGRVVWYYMPEVTGAQLVRPLSGGTFLMNIAGQGTGTGFWGTGTQVMRQQVLREFDLAGNVRRETNADRISEQLMTLGTDPIGRFNHDAIRLANGYTIALGDVQRIYPAGTQGSPVPLDVVGELIVLLDRNWQVTWFWNSLDHAAGGLELDINRAPIRGETCTTGSNGLTQPGCPPILLTSPAPDWLHANSIQLLADGNLLMSLRNQDWIIKIDYRNGTGTGAILWRMGPGGDFTMDSSDPFPWFTGQHEPAFEDGSLLRMSVFDNGNTRVQKFGGHSRGQVLNVDEANRVVSLALNADLGVYSSSQGSAQPLSGGNWHFLAGSISAGAGMIQQSIETDSSGAIVYTLQQSDVTYRSWRLKDVYTAPGT